MNYACPHCAAANEIDHSTIPEKGIAVTCSECKKKLWIYRESFGGRALRKSGEIFCVQCGSELRRSIMCPSCGTMYPGFFVVQKTRAVRKRVPKVKRSFVFTRASSFGPRRRYVALPQQAVKKSKALYKYSLAALIVLCLCAAGGYFYLQMQAEKQYTKNFIRSLYGIKAGADQGFNSCHRIVEMSREAAAAKRAFVFRLNSKDDARVNRIKSEVDKLMQLTGNPPKKYTAANEKLANLYGVFTRVHSLTLTPPESMQSFSESVGKLEREFKNGAQELKSVLPGNLSEELQKAQVRHKELRSL